MKFGRSSTPRKDVTKEIADERIAGSVWTWTAIDADTKLIPCWLIGRRDGGCATEFLQDLAGRLANRVQLTTDGLKVYLNAVLDSFGTDIDYAILHKVYGAERPDAARYSPAVCVGCDKMVAIGNPDEAHISTSYVERANLTMRMSMRRFTRLTNAFSKKLENHAASVAVFMTWYNFGRVHQTLKMTPAMRAHRYEAMDCGSDGRLAGRRQTEGPRAEKVSFKLTHYQNSCRRWIPKDASNAPEHSLIRSVSADTSMYEEVHGQTDPTTSRPATRVWFSQIRYTHQQLLAGRLMSARATIPLNSGSCRFSTTNPASNVDLGGAVGFSFRMYSRNLSRRCAACRDFGRVAKSSSSRIEYSGLRSAHLDRGAASATPDVNWRV